MTTWNKFEVFCSSHSVCGPTIKTTPIGAAFGSPEKWVKFLDEHAQCQGLKIQFLSEYYTP